MDVTKSLQKRKASGPDMIEGEHIIYDGDIINKLLTALLNAILVTGYVPDSFRKGFTIPILKGPVKDPKNSGNYRGISLLSNLSKVLEKLILHRLNEIVSLNPLQGGFRHGLSSNHTAFILQEAISSFRRKKKKAYVAFLDAQKAFDSVWHSGLLVKLRDKGVPPHIWKVIKHWYTSSFTAVLWDEHPSEFIPIDQGVRQGAILSPLLYSIYVDELLDTLAASGAGAHINSLYVGAPMFADDLALVADSPTSLQSLINLVHSYTIKWRYKINPAKSAILVFGEATRTRSTNRGLRSWSIGSATISEQDEVHHLGILRSVHSSIISRTNERASSGRSAFFSLNAIGTRFGCLHPSTSLKLYNAVCLPIMLFGSEILQPDVLVRKLLTERITTPTTDGVIPRWNSLLELYSLPSITELLTKPPCSKHTWKKSCRSILASIHYNLMLSDCKSLPLAQCSSKSFTTCKIVHQWLISKGDRQMFRRSNLRIRLLVGCVRGWRLTQPDSVTENQVCWSVILPVNSVTLVLKHRSILLWIVPLYRTAVLDS